MKYIICIFVLFLTMNLVAEETTPIQQYFANPDAVTFQNAWKSCVDDLAKDPNSKSAKILMATLANYESGRLIDEIYPSAKSLPAGEKFQFANLLLNNQKYDIAIPLYQSLNDSLPKWSCPWRHKGTALYNQKRFKEAEQSLLKAVETNPEHYDAFIWLARTQYEMKKYKLALENLEIALKLNPNAEENNDEVLSEDSINTLHKELLKKNGKK